MKKTIRLRPQAKNYADLAQQSGAYERILRDVFASRGAELGKHNDYTLAQILLPDQLLGIGRAVELLEHALKNNQRMLIVGDFDADGATSTAVAIRCLQAFGCDFLDYLVPNRFIYGYGLTPEIVAVAAERKPDLIITVDNGISSIEGVRAARALGIKVLVTDHHLPGKETPDADAVVNPNQHGCDFSSKNLAGVGVIFYVMLALRKKLRECDWFNTRNIPEPNLGNVLDLVALGTVADVVPLDYNNRILVSAGLQKMRAGNASPGIAALLHIAGKEPARLHSNDLGFAVGPRLNAAGRLDDMSLGIQCLLADNFHSALQYAQELDELNRDRKLIETSMQHEAAKQFENFSQKELAAQSSGVCLYQKDWHQGVIGILASRIKDKTHRPTIIFADTDDGDLKGSGRSISGIHLRDILDEMASAHPGLIEKFGGHAMAAGLSLQRKNLAIFKAVFNSTVEQHLTDELIAPIVLSDGELPESLLTLDFAHYLKNHGPWGQHFPEPIFHGTFRIVSQRIVGEKHLKLVLAKEDDTNKVFDAIAFNIDTLLWPNPEAEYVQVAFHLDVNYYRGEEKVQLMVVDVSI